jgi:hypothetical protein
VGGAAEEADPLSFTHPAGCIFRRHLAQRRHLYATAVTPGDLRTALAVLADESKLTCLYLVGTVEARLDALEKKARQLRSEKKGTQADAIQKPEADTT